MTVRVDVIRDDNPSFNTQVRYEQLGEDGMWFPEPPRVGDSGQGNLPPGGHDRGYINNRRRMIVEEC